MSVAPAEGEPRRVHRISVVIPVYKGETTLPGLLAEIEPLTTVQSTPAGHRFQITQVLPVWDNGPDHSDQVIRKLNDQYSFIHPVWLSRNYGQHPATMAGMASSNGDWIITMDEDGQHDPHDIAAMLDTALAQGASVVYAKPTNPPPHGAFRNMASRLAKRFLAAMMGSKAATDFFSFRLVLGETGRALAAYAGPNVYLDVALGWISRKTVTCPLVMRTEDRPSGYNLHSLMSHFLRMVVTSGTRGLRMVSFTGLTIGVVGVVVSVILAIRALTNPVGVPGWSSLICVLLIGLGLILFTLGIIAEYLGVTINAAMGKPLYLIVSDPAHGPLALDDQATPPATNPSSES